VNLPDQTARDYALDTTRSLLVQAPAGSGKTGLLIQRYLALLGCVAQPESVLAITFTRKAAAEMRRRVLDALERAAGPRPEHPHEIRTWELARAAQQRDRRLAWALSENPHRLQIRTIDSFCAALVRRMPWLSRLGAPPEILDDATELYREAARTTVALVDSDQYGRPLARLLLHLDNDVAALEDLLIAMLARRDQWLRHLAADRAELDASLARVVRDYLESLAQAWHPYAPLAPDLCPDPQPGCQPEDLPAWQSLADALLTKEGKWRKAVLRRLPALESDQPLLSLLERVRLLAAPHFPDSQWEVVEAVVHSLKLAAAQLQLAFRTHRQADYIEVAQAALRALGAPDSPTDLMLALDHRIEHILVDEFQDTSLTQYRLLEMLTAGWTPGDGRTLFLVGDPMQSIYRFREAEVGLFLKAAREGLGSVRLEPLKLSVNFRSDRRLIQWVNSAFPSVLAPADEIATGAVQFSFSHPRPQAPENGVVKIHPFIGERRPDEEAERIIEIIRDVQARHPEARIALLVRARNHLPAILRALRDAGLPYRAVEIESLAEVPLVQDLLALTRALLHPADRIAWLAILRAPWCGLTLRDLHALVADDHKAAVWELISDPDRLARLDQQAQARLRRLRMVLKTCFEHRRGSLRDWVESAWIALGGPACAQYHAELENAEAFFNLLEQLDGGSDLELELLEQRVQSLWANPDPEAPDTLQVMTIHKAKGLEFDVVIVPALGCPPKSDPPRLLAWLELPGDTFQSELLLAPIAEKGGADSIYEFLNHLEKQKAEHEAGRLLYVAATRARRELHLLGHATVKQKGNALEVNAHARSLLRKLWPAVQAQFQELAGQRSEQLLTAPEQPPYLLLRRLPADFQPPPPPESLRLPAAPHYAEIEAAETPVTYLWVGETLRHVGTVVHRLLHRIADEGLSRWDPARVSALRPLYQTALRDLGVSPSEIEPAADKVERALLQTLADPRGRWILDDSHSAPQNECALTGLVEGKLVSVRIDRTFVDPAGIRWIIDYKTGLHSGGSPEEFLDNEMARYRDQLERYAALFRRMDSRPIRLGLYFPLMTGWREWGAPVERTAG